MCAEDVGKTLWPPSSLYSTLQHVFEVLQGEVAKSVRQPKNTGLNPGASAGLDRLKRLTGSASRRNA